MENNVCGKCAHYYQHYVMDRKRILQVYCGHCVLQRAKKRNPDTPACENFSPAPSVEGPFATKEYLTKELLQYVLHLELLPEIENEIRKQQG